MLEPSGGPHGSSMHSVTALCLARAFLDCFGDCVPVGGDVGGGSSLASNPNVCIRYRREIFLCHLHTMERQGIDVTEP